jgi:hypothetical protein
VLALHVRVLARPQSGGGRRYRLGGVGEEGAGLDGQDDYSHGQAGRIQRTGRPHGGGGLVGCHAVVLGVRGCGHKGEEI